MDFFETAIDLEESMIRNYKDLAERCNTHEGVRNMLLMLAADQEKHHEIFSGFKERKASMVESAKVFKHARTLFEDMQDNRDTFSCDMDQLKMYEQARDLLVKKREFYTQALDRFTSSEDRSLLEKIIDEENRQTIVLENIIEMVNRPNSWIEDAEFNHLDEY